MKSIKYIAIIGVVAFLSSCSFTINTPGVSPGSQMLVTKNPVGSKRGVAERSIWLGLAFGETDLSIMKAAKKGKITKIATVDFEVEASVLGLKKTYRTIVTGTNDEPEPEKKSKKRRRSRRKRK